MLSKLFEFIAKTKVYFGSAGMYLSIANFLMLLATFKLAYSINISAYIIVPVGFAFIIFVGWLDYHLIYLRQSKHANQRNDLKIQLNRIEKKLDKIKNVKDA